MILNQLIISIFFLKVALLSTNFLEMPLEQDSTSSYSSNEYFSVDPNTDYCIQKINQTFFNYSLSQSIERIVYSAQNLNELGHYSLCTNDEYSSLYIVMNFYHLDSFFFSVWGLCVPEECQEYNLNILETQLNIFFKNASFLITSEGTHFEVKIRSNYYYHYELFSSDWAGSSLVIALTLVIIIVSLLGSWVYYDRKSYSKKVVRTSLKRTVRITSINDELITPPKKSISESFLELKNDSSDSSEEEGGSIFQNEREMKILSSPIPKKQETQEEFKDSKIFAEDSKQSFLLYEDEYYSHKENQTHVSAESFPKKNKNQLLPYEKILICLALSKNWNELFQRKNKNNETNRPFLNSFDGIKFFNFIWMILFQTSFCLFLRPLVNPYDMTGFTTSEIGHVAINGFHSSNVFFFLSGFLAFYNVHDRNDKIQWTTVLKLYFYRFFRLAPIYYAMYLYGSILGPFIFSGPVWYCYHKIFEHCSEKWYSNIFFFGNFLSDHHFLTDTCMYWDWQIFTDFQLFLLVPLLAVLFRYKKRICIWIILGIIICCCVAIFIVSFCERFNLFPFSMSTKSLYQLLIEKPYYSAPVYFLGVLMSILYLDIISYQESDESDEDIEAKYPKIKWLFDRKSYVSWISLVIALGLMAVTIFGFPLENRTPPDKLLVNLMHSFYFAFDHVILILGYCFLLVPLMVDQLSLVRKLLSSKAWVPLSNISYAGYVLSAPLIMLMYSSSKESEYLDLGSEIMSFCGNLVIIVVGATLFYILIELPFKNLKDLFIEGL